MVVEEVESGWERASVRDSEGGEDGEEGLEVVGVPEGAVECGEDAEEEGCVAEDGAYEDREECDLLLMQYRGRECEHAKGELEERGEFSVGGGRREEEEHSCHDRHRRAEDGEVGRGGIRESAGEDVCEEEAGEGGVEGEKERPPLDDERLQRDEGDQAPQTVGLGGAGGEAGLGGWREFI